MPKATRASRPSNASSLGKPASQLVRDARERYVRLAGGQAEQVVVGELYRVVRTLDAQRPTVAVYARRGDRSIYKVEVLVRSEERRHPGHVEGRLGGRLGGGLWFRDRSRSAPSLRRLQRGRPGAGDRRA